MPFHSSISGPSAHNHDMVTSSSTVHPDIDEVLLTQEAIAARVSQLGR